MVKKETVKYAIFGLLFSLALSIIFIEVSLRIFPQLLPVELNYRKYISLDPDVGTKLKPNYEIDMRIGDGDTYHVRTVDVGFPGIGFRDDGINGTVHGVVVGDSFVFGEGLNISDTWVETLERVSGRDFVNMGISGHGTEHEGRFVKKYGAELGPKVVILMFHENDFGNNYGYLTTENQEIRNFLSENSITYEMAKYILRRTTYENQRYYEGNNIRYQNGSFDLLFPVGWWWTKADSISEGTKFGEEVTERNFRELKALGEDRGFEFIVVLMPLKETVYSDLVADRVDLSSYDIGYPIRSALEICERTQVECLDLTPILRERGRGEQLYFAIDGHINKRGSEVVAEEVFDFLKRRSLV